MVSDHVAKLGAILGKVGEGLVFVIQKIHHIGNLTKTILMILLMLGFVIFLINFNNQIYLNNPNYNQ